MALIPCPECRHQVSDLAAQCPSCGYPIASVRTSPASAAPDYSRAPIADVPMPVLWCGALVLLLVSGYHVAATDSQNLERITQATIAVSAVILPIAAIVALVAAWLGRPFLRDDQGLSPHYGSMLHSTLVANLCLLSAVMLLWKLSVTVVPRVPAASIGAAVALWLSPCLVAWAWSAATLRPQWRGRKWYVGILVGSTYAMLGICYTLSRLHAPS
jgi:hypothetical protein